MADVPMSPGVHGSGGILSTADPGSWRAGVFMADPNGDTPLTGLTSQMSSEKVRNHRFDWHEELLPVMSYALVGDGIFTEVSLTTAYVSGATTGDVLFAKISASNAQELRAGYTVQFSDLDNPPADVVGKIIDRVIAGTQSYAAVQLYEADQGAGALLSACDKMTIIGDAHPQNGEVPAAVGYNPEAFHNFTEIFKETVSISRTLEETQLRTGDERDRRRASALKRHMVKIEKQLMFGVKNETTGDNGETETVTDGLITSIRANASGNVDHYPTNATYTTSTWLAAGATWFREFIENLFLYGPDTRLAFCGAACLTAIEALAETIGQVTLKTRQLDFGMRVREWVSPHGVILFKRHPLMSQNPSWNRSAVIFNPDNIKYRFVTDTKYLVDKKVKSGEISELDGRRELWLTECGLEFHFPDQNAYLTGFGLDGATS